MVRKRPYKEGDWFAVPLKSGYVLGRIARVGRRGGILLGYFFEPLCASPPAVQDTVGLTARGAFHIEMFGDGGLQDGEWPIIHSAEEWRREDWPMPEFGRINAFVSGLGHAVRYDDNDPCTELSERRIPAEHALHMPPDGLAGHIALQRGLERYFREGQPEYDPDETHRAHVWFHGLPDDMEELERDPAYVWQKQEIEPIRHEKRRFYREAEAPLLEELARAGCPVGTIKELRESISKGCVYQSAIPIVLHWLPRMQNVAVRDEIAWALAVPWAKPTAAPALIEEFKHPPADPKGHYRRSVGNALRLTADDTFFDEIADLAVDPKYGTARDSFVIWLGKSKTRWRWTSSLGFSRTKTSYIPRSFPLAASSRSVPEPRLSPFLTIQRSGSAERRRRRLQKSISPVSRRRAFPVGARWSTEGHERA